MTDEDPELSPELTETIERHRADGFPGRTDRPRRRRAQIDDTTTRVVDAIAAESDLRAAVAEYVSDCLAGVPRMTPQTLGRNVKDRVFSWVCGGGWGYDNSPRFQSALSDLTEDDYSRVSEERLGDFAQRLVACTDVPDQASHD